MKIKMLTLKKFGFLPFLSYLGRYSCLEFLGLFFFESLLGIETVRGCVCVCVCVCVWQRCFTFYCSFLEQLAIILHCSDVLLSKANQHVGSVKWVATFWSPPLPDPTLVRILEFCFIKRFYPGLQRTSWERTGSVPFGTLLYVSVPLLCLYL